MPKKKRELSWPEQVPYFTADDIYLNPDNYWEPDNKPPWDGRGDVQGWFIELFVEKDGWGPWDLKRFQTAVDIFYQCVPSTKKYYCVEEWSDNHTKKEIATALNKTMKKLGYTEYEYIDN